MLKEELSNFKQKYSVLEENVNVKSTHEKELEDTVQKLNEQINNSNNIISDYENKLKSLKSEYNTELDKNNNLLEEYNNYITNKHNN